MEVCYLKTENQNCYYKIFSRFYLSQQIFRFFTLNPLIIFFRYLVFAKYYALYVGYKDEQGKILGGGVN